MGANYFAKRVFGGYRIKDVDLFIEQERDLQRRERAENKERLMRLRAANMYLQEKLDEVRADLSKLQERMQGQSNITPPPQAAQPLETPREVMDAELAQQAAAFYRQMNVWQSELGQARHEIKTIRRVSETMSESLDDKLAEIQRDMIAEEDEGLPSGATAAQGRRDKQPDSAADASPVQLMSAEEERELKSLYHELREIWNAPSDSAQ